VRAGITAKAVVHSSARCRPAPSIPGQSFHPERGHPSGRGAAFAASFAERFGTETESREVFLAEMRNLCGAAEAKKDCFLDSP